MTTVDTWVELALSTMSTEAREAFALSPLATMRDALGLIVTPVEALVHERETGGACDGVSFLSERVVFYAPTNSSKRENFTLAHEVGHWLIDQSDSTLDWVADQEDASLALESLCDRVAQRLLLPEDLVDQFVAHPLRAQQIIDLYEGSAASRPVAAIAAANRLASMGAVIIVDRNTREVTFSSVRPHSSKGWPTVYPWRGQYVPDEHFLASMEPGRSLTRRSFWRSPWGVRQDYYVDAIVDNTQVIAVFASTDIWQIESMPVLIDRAYDQRLAAFVSCCGERRAVRGYPCPRCRQHFCPECGDCRCTRVAAGEQRCLGCNCLAPAHTMTEGLCEMCF